MKLKPTAIEKDMKKKRKEFRITQLEMLKTKVPGPDSWASAHLFWGVPRWAKYIYQDINGDMVFTNLPI